VTILFSVVPLHQLQLQLQPSGDYICIPRQLNRTAANNSGQRHLAAANNGQRQHAGANNSGQRQHAGANNSGQRQHAGADDSGQRHLTNTNNCHHGFTTPTTPPATTTAPTVGTVFRLFFSLQQQFSSALSTQGSPEFTQLKSNIESQLTPVYALKYGRLFVRFIVFGFSPGSVVVNSTVELNDTTTNATDVATTLQAAVTSGNLTLNISASSINATFVPAPPATTTTTPVVITSAFPGNSTVQPPTTAANVTSPPPTTANVTSLPPTTANVTSLPPTAANVTSLPPTAANVSTAAPTTAANVSTPAPTTAANVTSPTPTNVTTVTTPTTPPATTTAPTVGRVFLLFFSLQQQFSSALSTQGSPEFTQLKSNIESQLTPVYARKYGRLFVRFFVFAFSSGSVVVNSTVELNDTTTNATDVAATLQAAVTSGNLTLNISASSINATLVLTTTTTAPVVTTTALPGTSTTLASATTPTATTTTTAPASATTSTTTAASTVASTTTPAPTTTTPNTNAPSPSEGFLFFKFSLNQIFTSDLADNTSAGYQALAGKVVTELNRVGQLLYPSFRRSRVNYFLSGSVVGNTTLVFDNQSSTPAASNASNAFAQQLLNSTVLNFIPGSFSANSSSSLWSTFGSLLALCLTLFTMGQLLTDF
ncbi:mucin-2-like, partial [Betta splendens]|uniref:Mucin-1 n=1 Tax=Betta splendens TaxID=158456 RepID=A0A6P7N7B9_BETSP